MLSCACLKSFFDIARPWNAEAFVTIAPVIKAAAFAIRMDLAIIFASKHKLVSNDQASKSSCIKRAMA